VKLRHEAFEDAGGPLGAGLQEQASNDPKLLRSRAVVVSVGGKGTTRSCHVRFRETSASEPLMRCRKQIGGIKTEGLSFSQEKSRRNLFTVWMVSGMQVAVCHECRRWRVTVQEMGMVPDVGLQERASNHRKLRR